MSREAVQFAEFGPWHLVSDDDGSRTLCGRGAVSAHRMWRSWDDILNNEQCLICRSSRRAALRLADDYAVIPDA